MQFFNPRLMWFGTINRMRWIPAPKRGADMSPEAWGEGGTLLNGGGYESHSWGSHKVNVFEWGPTTANTVAQTMKSYRDGVFGKGLIYFIDPNIYNKNVLPARWAAPSMATGYEGASHVYGVEPSQVSVSGGEDLDLPIFAAQYNLGKVSAGYRGDGDTVFIPIPEGMTAYVGAIYTASGSGAVFVSPVNDNGTRASAVALTKVDPTDTNIVPDDFSGGKGIRLWFGKSSSGASTVTVTAITVRLYDSSLTPPADFFTGPWIGGMGNSGCRFSGPPTYVPYGYNGGSAEFAATFRETGDFE